MTTTIGLGAGVAMGDGDDALSDASLGRRVAGAEAGVSTATLVFNRGRLRVVLRRDFACLPFAASVAATSVPNDSVVCSSSAAIVRSKSKFDEQKLVPARLLRDVCDDELDRVDAGLGVRLRFLTVEFVRGVSLPPTLNPRPTTMPAIVEFCAFFAASFAAFAASFAAFFADSFAAFAASFAAFFDARSRLRLSVSATRLSSLAFRTSASTERHSPRANNDGSGPTSFTGVSSASSAVM